MPLLSVTSGARDPQKGRARTPKRSLTTAASPATVARRNSSGNSVFVHLPLCPFAHPPPPPPLSVSFTSVRLPAGGSFTRAAAGDDVETFRAAAALGEHVRECVRSPLAPSTTHGARKPCHEESRLAS